MHAVESAGGADARVVVVPELSGHLALYALAPPHARRAKTLGSALAAAAVRRPLDILRGVATTRLLDARHTVLAALAPDGERWWKSVFAPLARRLDAYLVAGSHLRLAAEGSLTNASLLFGPDGRLLATTDKVNLVPGVEDGAPGALALARGEHVPIVETPLGRIATLVGYDAFRAPHTEHERFVALAPQLAHAGGVAIVANPAAQRLPAPGPWQGLGTSLDETPFARHAITAHLVGSVLDLAFAGTSEILERTEEGIHVLARAERGGHVAGLVSCYG